MPDAVVEVWAEATHRNTAWVEEKLKVDVAAVPGFGNEFPELDGCDAYGGYVAVDGRISDQILFRALAEARCVQSRYAASPPRASSSRTPPAGW